MKPTHTTPKELRGNPRLKERVHDPYRASEKLGDSVRCPDCGVEYHNGRWVWPETEGKDLKAQSCPACRRVADGYPAGELILSGSFLEKHRDEVLATATNIEEGQRAEHPLNRIIAIEQRDGETVITTTDIHLPHGIAHALKDAWGGEMETHYDEEGYFTRVQWGRDD